MTLSHQDVRKILEILDQSSSLDSIKLQTGDIYIQAKRRSSAVIDSEIDSFEAKISPSADETSSPAQPSKQDGAVSVPVAEKNDEGVVAVRAPMAGVFYTSPKPGEPEFVKPGSEVQRGTPLAIVEAMKMFNTISSPATGQVMEVRVKNETPVSLDQVLVLIKPQ